jgi:hypothetical protein
LKEIRDFRASLKIQGSPRCREFNKFDDLDEARIFGDALKLRTVVYFVLPGKSCAAGNAAASAMPGAITQGVRNFLRKGFIC